jgi:hypothetical protein
LLSDWTNAEQREAAALVFHCEACRVRSSPAIDLHASIRRTHGSHWVAEYCTDFREISRWLANWIYGRVNGA